jgi:hypothetical protein
MLDGCQGDRAKARNIVGIGEPLKAKDAVRRLECDRQACVGNGGFKVAPNWMLHRLSPKQVCTLQLIARSAQVAAQSVRLPKLGAKPTCRGHRQSVVNDPFRKSSGAICCDAQVGFRV